MTPQEHDIHQFIRDLNRHIFGVADLARRVEPPLSTDEHTAYMRAIENAEEERADLEKRLEAMLYKG